MKDKSVRLFAGVSHEDVVTITSGPVEPEVVEPSRNDFVREHNDNIENILEVVNRMDKKMDILIKKSEEDLCESSVCTPSKNIEKSFEENVRKLQVDCVSVESVLKNPIVEDVFELDIQEDTGLEVLKCKVCRKSGKFLNTAIIIDGGSSYSVIDKKTGIKGKMQKWFSNLKQKVIKHIQSSEHVKASTEYKQLQTKVSSIKAEIFHSMRQLAYFTIKSNLPFQQFPALLATVNCCGLGLGDINHSEYFIRSFLDLINNELCRKTVEWIKDCEEVTITLDIGTVSGITLLSTLLIRNTDGSVKLCSLDPITSKKGDDVAVACYNSLLMKGEILPQEINERVVGITGDGAFAKGNKPFKNKIMSLLEKEVPVRWDLLHLFNVAHKDARGDARYDKETEIVWEDDDSIELSVGRVRDCKVD